MQMVLLLHVRAPAGLCAAAPGEVEEGAAQKHPARRAQCSSLHRFFQWLHYHACAALRRARAMLASGRIMRTSTPVACTTVYTCDWPCHLPLSPHAHSTLLLVVQHPGRIPNRAQTHAHHADAHSSSVLRVQDCFNRPIASAPDRVIDVLTRTPVSGQKCVLATAEWLLQAQTMALCAVTRRRELYCSCEQTSINACRHGSARAGL